MRVFNEQVMVRRRDVDSTRLDALHVAAVQSGKRTGALEDFRKQSRALGAGVKNDEDRRVEAGRESLHERSQSFDAARGRTYYDDIFSEHSLL